MIRYQESLFPSHEHGTAVAVRHGQMRPLELVSDMAKSMKTLPMYHIVLFVRSPLLCQEPIPAAYDFGVEVGRQLGPIFRQTTYAKIATKKRRGQVNILSRHKSLIETGQWGNDTYDDGDGNIIAIPSALLGAFEGGTGV